MAKQVYGGIRICQVGLEKKFKNFFITRPPLGKATISPAEDQPGKIFCKSVKRPKTGWKRPVLFRVNGGAAGKNTKKLSKVVIFLVGYEKK